MWNFSGMWKHLGDFHWDDLGLQINGTAEAVCKQAQEGGQVFVKFSKHSQCLHFCVMTTFKRWMQ